MGIIDAIFKIKYSLWDEIDIIDIFPFYNFIKSTERRGLSSEDLLAVNTYFYMNKYIYYVIQIICIYHQLFNSYATLSAMFTTLTSHPAISRYNRLNIDPTLSQTLNTYTYL